MLCFAYGQYSSQKRSRETAHQRRRYAREKGCTLGEIIFRSYRTRDLAAGMAQTFCGSTVNAASYIGGSALEEELRQRDRGFW